MDPDSRYEHALAAALVILDQFDRSPGEPKHQRLAQTLFSILHAMDRYEEEKERRDRRVGFSTN
ncbi:hypothetical protein ACYOEI_21940 [Singulisphaera rosea]